MIEEKVKDILKKYRNLEQKKDWKDVYKRQEPGRLARKSSER